MFFPFRKVVNTDILTYFLKNINMQDKNCYNHMILYEKLYIIYTFYICVIAAQSSMQCAKAPKPLCIKGCGDFGGAKKVKKISNKVLTYRFACVIISKHAVEVGANYARKQFESLHDMR